jgi:hypothetical protein
VRVYRIVANGVKYFTRLNQPFMWCLHNL